MRSRPVSPGGPTTVASPASAPRKCDEHQRKRQGRKNRDGNTEHPVAEQHTHNRTHGRSDRGATTALPCTPSRRAGQVGRSDVDDRDHKTQGGH